MGFVPAGPNISGAANQSAAGTDPQQPPPKGSDPGLIRAFLDRRAPYDHSLHIRRHATWRKADLYLQSQQWLRASHNTDPTRTPHWSQIEYNEDDPDAIPMPVYNEIIGYIQNEAARLGRPEYKPYIRPTGATPDAKTREGASRATEILLAYLDEMGWDERAEMGYHHLPLYGGWTIKSWWDTSMEKTVRVPTLDSGGNVTAVKCQEPGCDFKLSSSALSPEHALAEGFDPDHDGDIDSPGIPGFDSDAGAPLPPRIDITPSKDAKGNPSHKITAAFCLTCDTHTEQQQTMAPATDETGQPMMGPDGALVQIPMTTSVAAPGPSQLQPFTPTGDELYQKDHFGRDMGQDLPLGEWKVKTCSPYDMFWENLGVDVLIDGDPQGWREVLEIHVESLDWIRSRYPDKANDVKAESTEALLKWHPIAGERALFYSSAVGVQLFKNHCRVKEFHKKPYMEKDQASGTWKMNRGRSIIMAGQVVLMDGDFLLESKNNPGTFIPRVHFDYVPWELRSGGRELHGLSLTEELFDPQDNINEAKSQTQDARQRMASPKWLLDRRLNLDYEECGGAGSHWLYDAIVDAPGVAPVPVGSTTIAGGVAAEIESDIDFMGRVSGRAEVEQGSVPSGVSAAAAIQILAEQTAEKRRPRIRRIRKAFERVWHHGLELMHEFVREDRIYKTKNEANEWAERSWSGLDIMGQTDVRIDPEPEADTSIQKQERIRDGIQIGVLNAQSSPRAAMVIAKELSIPNDLYLDQNQQYDAAEREFIDYLELARVPVVDTTLDDHPSHIDQHGTDMHGEKWRDLARQASWSEVLQAIWGWEQLYPSLDQQAGQQWPPALELRIFQCWNYMLSQSAYMNQRMRPTQEKQALGVVMRFRAHLEAHKMLMERQQAAAQQGAQIAAAPAAPSTQAGTIVTQGQPQAAQR